MNTSNTKVTFPFCFLPDSNTKSSLPLSLSTDSIVTLDRKIPVDIKRSRREGNGDTKNAGEGGNSALQLVQCLTVE